MPILETNPDVARGLPRSLGVPRDFKEQFRDSFELAKIADRSFGGHAALSDEYQGLADEVFKRTGTRLDLHRSLNPENRATRPGNYGDQISQDRDSFLTDLQRLAQENPGVLDDLPSDSQSLQDLVTQKAKRLTETTERDLAIDPSLGSFGTNFLGMSAGMMTDPVLLGTLFAGAPARAPILAGMAREALLGAATEAGLQIPIQQNRKDLGLEHGLEQAIKNVAAVGAGAPVLYGLLRGAGMGADKMIEVLRGKPPEALTADERILVQQLEEMAESTRTTPVVEPMAPDMRAHRRNTDQALLDLESGKVANISRLKSSDLPDTLMKASELPPLINRIAQEYGLDLTDELMPGLTRALSMTSDRFQAALARDRVNDFTERMARASGNEREVLEKARNLEEKIANITVERSQVQARIQILERANAGEQDAIDHLFAGALGKQPSLEALDAKLRLGAGFKYKGSSRAVNKRTNEIGDRLSADTARLGELDRTYRESVSGRRSLADDIAKVQRGKNKAGKQFVKRIDSLFSDQELARISAERDKARYSGTQYYPLSEKPTPQETQSVEMAAEATEALDRLEAQGEAIADATLASIRGAEDKVDLDVLGDSELKQAIRESVEALDAKQEFVDALAGCLIGVAEAATKGAK